MNITKFGQCCLLIETAGKRILTDPGRFSISQNEITGIDLILITHEHADHLHTASLSTILSNNPEAQIVCNGNVGKILKAEGILYTLLEGRETALIKELALKAYDGEHAEIFADFGQVQNTGYFIADELFYPGDAYTVPDEVVRVLALPVAGPWCQLPDALKYAIQVAPEVAFPVHDWVLSKDGVDITYSITNTILTKNDIRFVPIQNDETKDL